MNPGSKKSSARLKFTIITLFREAIEPYLKSSMMEKATRAGLAEFVFVNLRDFGLGPHRSVDDKPYGGGDGMLMRCEPVFAAIESVTEKDPTAKIIIPTPSGRLWTQAFARELLDPGPKTNSLDNASDYPKTHGESSSPFYPSPVATESGAPDLGLRPGGDLKREELDPLLHFIIFCPHYEGFDSRIKTLADYEISLGKYILTGGELPALIIIDTLVRLVPGVLGGETSAEIESFSSDDTLEYPQYTKPSVFRGMKVPDVLLSGNHGAVDQWRAEHSPKFDGTGENTNAS